MTHKPHINKPALTPAEEAFIALIVRLEKRLQTKKGKRTSKRV